MFQISYFVARMDTLCDKLEVCLPLAYLSTIYKHFPSLKPFKTYLSVCPPEPCPGLCSVPSIGTWAWGRLGAISTPCSRCWTSRGSGWSGCPARSESCGSSGRDWATSTPTLPGWASSGRRRRRSGRTRTRRNPGTGGGEVSRNEKSPESGAGSWNEARDAPETEVEEKRPGITGDFAFLQHIRKLRRGDACELVR